MIGVVILTFRSADVIEACLSSLPLGGQTDLRVVICDNASDDDTCDTIRGWADRAGQTLAERTADDGAPGTDALTLVQTGANLGFAGGVNIGLTYLMQDPRVDLFWILNPDCEALPQTAAAFRARADAAGPFALMGGRIRFRDGAGHIQSDGGRVLAWSGICRNVNNARLPEEAVLPAEDSLDFISGASMVASRSFIERAGPMVEDYFLYYEEVDWAARRGDLPLILCPEAEVLHIGGTAIGSGIPGRRASAFSNYFNFRNRMRFMRRFAPARLPIAWGLSMLRVAKLVLFGAWSESWAAFAGLNGLPPPQDVKRAIARQDHDRAFNRKDAQR